MIDDINIFLRMTLLFNKRRQITMLGPVVCLSCNNRLSNLFETVSSAVCSGSNLNDALDDLLDPVQDICCRRSVMCQVQYFELLCVHDDRHQDYPSVSMQRTATRARRVKCV